MSTGYSWEGIRQVSATLLGARHVPTWAPLWWPCLLGALHQVLNLYPFLPFYTQTDVCRRRVLHKQHGNCEHQKSINRQNRTEWAAGLRHYSGSVLERPTRAVADNERVRTGVVCQLDQCPRPGGMLLLRRNQGAYERPDPQVSVSTTHKRFAELTF